MKTALPPIRSLCRALALGLSAVGLVLAAPALGAVGEFQLPPGATPAPQVQGPVVDGIAPARRVEQPAATPAPTPEATPSSPPSATTRAPVPSASPTRAARPPSPASATAQPDAPVVQAVPAAAEPDATPFPQPIANQPVDEPGASWWPWLLGLAGLGAALAGGWFIWRRREEAPLLVPLIERPWVQPRAVVPEPVAAEPAPPAAIDDEPEEEPAALRIALEARQLSLTLLATTLSYRITLTNNSAAAMVGLVICADMIAAHASLSREDQLAGEASELAECHRIDRIGAGRSVMVSGELRLVLPKIRPIMAGDAALFVPLARLRVSARGGLVLPVIQTVVVGQPSARPGTGLQPFRLDLGPRIFREVTQKIFS